MRLGYVCTRTLLTAGLVLAAACSENSGGQDQNKGTDAGAGFRCPQEGDTAVICVDASPQVDSSTSTGADSGDDAMDDAAGGQ